MTTVVVSALAETDIATILDYLAAAASPRIAAAYGERFAQAIEFIAEFPGAGAPRPALGPKARIAIVYPYVLIYDDDSAAGNVALLRVLHGRRNITRRLLSR